MGRWGLGGVVSVAGGGEDGVTGGEGADASGGGDAAGGADAAGGGLGGR